MDVKKILFFDIETVGCVPSFDKLDERKAKLWMDWQEKYKESNGNQTMDELFVQKAGLHPEYGKVVCASFGYLNQELVPIMSSFYGDNERDVLEKCAKVINNADANGMYLGGHNIEKFDVIFLWKRMLSMGIKPPSMINVWDKKPWDLKFFDTSKVWGNGSWKDSFTSLDTLSAVFDIESPKKDMKATEVHKSYWNDGRIEDIKKYCESDVKATILIAQQILNTIG